MTDWLRKRSRIYWYDQYAMNDQETAFSKYDPDRITEELIGTGADIVAVYAANQFSVAYYPSKIWPQHPKLNGRDYFGDLCSRLKSRGKRVVAYINWLESRHPEWNRVPLGEDRSASQAEFPLASWAVPSDPEWRVQNVPGGDWRVACFNSPRRRQVVEVAREIVERYRPDAFHLDMLLDGSVCVCDYCRPSLERICGTSDISREVIADHWGEFIRWRGESTASLLAEVSAVVRDHGVATAHNAFAPLFLEPKLGQTEAWLPSLDVFVSECFDAFLYPCSDLNSTSINVRWQHAVGKPSWILRTSSQVGYAHQALTEAQWLVYASACKANGADVFGPCGIGAYPDTTTAKAMLDNVKFVFDSFMEDADLHDGAVSAAKVALVFSWATRNNAGMDDLAWCEEFHGWARLLIEEHLPFDVVVAENTSSECDLSSYDLVILPNARCLSDAFCETIRSYVARGGRILATAGTSLCDQVGEARAELALADVLGAQTKGSVEGSFALERPGEPEPASGTFQQILSSGMVVSRRVDVDPAGSVIGGLDPLPLETSEWPAATIADFGKGKGLYIAFAVGGFYQKHGDKHIGQWMAEMVDKALAQRQIIVNGPRTVEVTLWRQESPERVIIHLANRSVAHTLPTNVRQFTEILPVHDFAVELDLPYPHPKVSCRAAEVESHVVGERLIARVAKLDAYAAIVIEPDNCGAPAF